MKRLASTLMLCFSLASPLCFSGESSTPSVDNIGFIQNPPKELKEKFPMCDAFLKVKWINRKQEIGMATYEAIMKGKDARHKGTRRKVTSLVMMADSYADKYDYASSGPALAGDLSSFELNGELDNLLKVIKEGEVKSFPHNRGINFGYRDGKTLYTVPELKAVNEGEPRPLLANHRETVCVPYPDGQRMWIVDERDVNHVYNAAQFDDFVRRAAEADFKVLPGEVPSPVGIVEIKKGLYQRDVVVNGTHYPIDPSLIKGKFGNFWVLDINHDGKDDYFPLFYSWQDRLYEVRTGYWADLAKEASDPGMIYIFPPQNRKCVVNSTHFGVYLTTDGKNFYLDNQCNLTEATTEKEGH